MSDNIFGSPQGLERFESTISHISQLHWLFTKLHAIWFLRNLNWIRCFDPSWSNRSSKFVVFFFRREFPTLRYEFFLFDVKCGSMVRFSEISEMLLFVVCYFSSRNSRFCDWIREENNYFAYYHLIFPKLGITLLIIIWFDLAQL